jgi:hypothetical protein
MSLKAMMFTLNGMPFFTHVIDPKFQMNIELTSGLLSAIEMFADNAYGDIVQSINMGANKINTLRVFLQDPAQVPGGAAPFFLMVAVCDNSADNTMIMNSMNALKKIFFEIYQATDVIEWDGNVLTFAPFKQVVNRIMSVKGINDSGASIGQYFKDSISRKGVTEGFAFMICGDSGRMMDIHTLDLEDQILSQIDETVRRDLANSQSFTWEGIIPFLDQQKIAYIYSRKVDVINEAQTGNSLGYLTASYILDAKYQIMLPRMIPQIQTLFVSLFQKMVNYQVNVIDDSLKEELENTLKNKKIIETVLAETKVETTLYNFSVIKDVDRLIHGLIIGTPVAVIGPPEETKSLIDNISLFTPHRHLRIVEKMDAKIKPEEVDVIAIDKKQEGNYKNFIIVNLEKHQVKNGVSNKFCQKLLNDIQSIPDAYLVSIFLKRKINWLVSKSTIVRAMSWSSEWVNKELGALRADLDADSESIILALASGNNSHLQNIVDKLSTMLPVSQLLLDQNFIKYNEKKVIVNMQLPEAKMKEYSERLLKLGKNMLGDRFLQMI